MKPTLTLRYLPWLVLMVGFVLGWWINWWFVCAGPIALVAGLIVFSVVDSRLKRKKLAGLRCFACNSVYGTESLREAEENYDRDCHLEYAEIQAGRDDVAIDINFRGNWSVKCPNCGSVSEVDPYRAELRQ